MKTAKILIFELTFVSFCNLDFKTWKKWNQKDQFCIHTIPQDEKIYIII